MTAVAGGFAVTIEDLAVSATTFTRLRTDVLDALGTAAQGLGAASGMAGDDTVLALWRDTYDPLAALTWAVAATTAGTLTDVAARLATTGNNYLDADRSAGGDAAERVPEPARPGSVPPAPPTSTGPVGPGVPADVAPFWPGGDPGMLRAAADAWSVLAGRLDDTALDADAAFRSLVGSNSGTTFSAIAAYWARHFENCGTDPLFNAAPTTARALARNCARLADVVDATRADVSRAAGEASEALSDIETPAQLLSRLTRGATEGILLIGKAALTTKFLHTYRDYYLSDLDQLVSALQQIDQAHLHALTAPPEPQAAIEVSLADVGEVVAVGLTGSAWDDVDGPHPDTVHLVERGREHILDGDSTGGGGHRSGTGRPGKSEFPASWSDDRVVTAVIGIARDPHIVASAEGASRWMAEGSRDGVTIVVVVEPWGEIVTAFPRSGPGVVQNPLR